MAKKKKARAKTRKKSKNPFFLPKIRPNVAGIDLGSKEHWVCCPPNKDGSPNVRVFGAVTSGLEALVSWLLEEGITSIAMESTHVYWIPLYELAESRGIEVFLVNARQMHNVPGRKTDMVDCQWLQLLHSCGLLRASFRPEDAICRLRAFRRQMGNLVQERTRAVQWMQKALDQMNVQVHRAVTDLTGKTGLSIVRSIVEGERDPQRLAQLRAPGCRKSEAEIAEFLTGTWRTEHLFNLEKALEMYDYLQLTLDSYEAKLLEEVRALQPPERREAQVPRHPRPSKESTFRRRGEDALRQDLWRLAGVDLTRIDGIGVPAATTVLTEVGLDLTSFPTENHFASWLRLSPRTGFSAGKPVKKTRNALGANRIANDLRMAALSLRRSKSALGAYYRHIARRKGANVAVFATARKLAILIYRMLRYGQEYVDIGEAAYEERFQERRFQGIAAAAKHLGYQLVPIDDHPTPAGSTG